MACLLYHCITMSPYLASQLMNWYKCPLWFQFKQEIKDKRRESTNKDNYNSNRDSNHDSNCDSSCDPNCNYNLSQGKHCKNKQLRQNIENRKVKMHHIDPTMGQVKYKVTHPSNGLSTLSLHCN